MRPLPLLSLAAVLGVCAFPLSCARATVEQPSYSVASNSKEGFELREYKDLRLASTPMEEQAAGNAMNSAFSRLFQYIQGQNEEKQKIAMTSPVLIGGPAGSRSMGFIVPEAVAAGKIPEPTGQSVSLSSFPAGTYAVLRFPGVRSEANEKNAAETLARKLAAASIRTDGPPSFAYYDPPWTPVPLRRNEVLLRVKP